MIKAMAIMLAIISLVFGAPKAVKPVEKGISTAAVRVPACGIGEAAVRVPGDGQGQGIGDAATREPAK